MRETFILPDIDALLNNREGSEKVVVISIIGKSSYNSSLKVKCVGRMFTTKSKDDKCAIEGYYDEENQVIYLHVSSLLDTDLLVEHYSSLAEKCIYQYESDDFLTIYNEVRNSFAQVLLILFHISHIVILSHPKSTFDVNYIQYFKAVEQLRQKYSNEISECLALLENNISREWIKYGRPCTPRVLFYFEQCPKGIENIKKLEHQAEDQIYSILRKVRIISSSSNANSLFAIPPNEEFVFMATESVTDQLGHAVRGLILGCQSGASLNIEVPFCSQPNTSHSFQNFLQVHIQQARDKGFDDTVVSSRHSQQHSVHFELATIKQWAQVAKGIYELIMQPKLLSPVLDIDTSFSKQRCLKVLPLAVARYQEGLPSHYTRAVHENRLAVALAFFGAQARGPLFHHYSTELLTECQTFWESGRQLCEAASLTGNPCNLPNHGPDIEHVSGVIYVAACDCGKKQSSRKDPYSPKRANYTFYQQLGKDCGCIKSVRIEFPIFEPSTKEYKAATLTTDSNDETLSVLSDRSELSAELDRGLSRQPSTTEYLPGMLTLSSPPGLLPYYSSWSLVYLGPSSLYSHNLGLSDNAQPGFLNSTNYLLPWDVTVYPKSKTPWPQINKHSIRGGRRLRPNNAPQFTVKVFIGMEYECPRGHRFMLAAPDRILRAAPGSIVKDTGHTIAESDMPLYFACPCRPGKPLSAQLMRLHVVTPKAPVHCTINPKVQPAAGAPVFVSTRDRPTPLTQSAYWIMRLPYVYGSDKETWPENYSARLLSGVFEVNAEEN